MRPKCHRTAVDIVPIDQMSKSISLSELLLQFSGKAGALPEAHIHWLQLIIHNFGVRKHHSSARVFSQHLCHPCQLIRMPDIVLVARCNDLPATQTYRLLEISEDSKPPGIFLDFDRKGDVRRTPS